MMSAVKFPLYPLGENVKEDTMGAVFRKLDCLLSHAQTFEEDVYPLSKTIHDEIDELRYKLGMLEYIRDHPEMEPGEVKAEYHASQWMKR